MACGGPSAGPTTTDAPEDKSLASADAAVAVEAGGMSVVDAAADGPSACAAGTAKASDGTCAACEPGTSCPGADAPKTACSADTWDSDGAPATPCVPKKTCAAGERITSAGSATSDRTCDVCADGTFSATDNASSCESWTECAAGSYAQTTPSSSHDRTCAACASSTFSSATDAPSCAAWTTCAPGTYVSSPPSATADRSCDTCAVGTFTSAPNLATCLPAGACPAGTVQTAAATSVTPATCMACTAGNHCAGGEAPVVACGGSTWDDDRDPATPCIAKTDCAAGSRVNDAGTATADRTCAACTTGYSSSTNAASCTTFTICTAGQYVSKAPSATSNRQCTACAASSYSSTTNAGSCTAWATCTPGTYVSSNGDAQNNRQCASCPAGTTTSDVNQASCTAVGTAPEAGAAGCAPLVRRDRTFSGNRAADEYEWADRACKSRTASLVRVDRKGGHALELSYTLANGTKRVAGISGESGTAPNGENIIVGGFGYVVSHLSDPTIAYDNNWDDSPLGSPLCANDTDPAHDYYTTPVCTTGWSRPFVGKHHAIHEFTVNYPRWGKVGGVEKRFDMPVTIDWAFHTGMDAMVYAITFDLSSAPAGAVVADMRAPYGSMNFDGVAAGTYGGTIGGVGWGDTKRFESLAPNGLTMNSPWKWTDANTGPGYNYEWTSSSDAEMGSIATAILSKMDAGGYSNGGASGRGSSSAAGFRCASDDYGASGHTMPCAPMWSYQSVNYSYYSSVGNPSINSTTASKRLAWGSDWGTLGKGSVTTVNGNVVKGSPRVSYSVFIALDTHSSLPARSVAAQVEVVNQTSLSAVIGSVRTTGPAGVGRSDTMTYSPAGYSPVYSTWELDAAGNSVSLGLDVGSGTLDRPTFVLHGWSSANPPTTVTLDGTTLTADTSYYASVRPGSQELWLTLDYKLTGTGHRLNIN